MSLSRKCVLTGCHHLQNRSMSLFKCPKNVHMRKRWIKATLMESWGSPPFFQNFDSLFYLLGFFYHSNLAGWLITHISVVWQTHNILNFDFTGTLNRNRVYLQNSPQPHKCKCTKLVTLAKQQVHFDIAHLCLFRVT